MTAAATPRVNWGTPDLPKNHTAYVAPLPEFGHVSGLKCETGEKTISSWSPSEKKFVPQRFRVITDIFACDVTDWADPYDQPSRIDGVRDFFAEWAQDVVVRVERTPADRFGPADIEFDCDEQFVCIINDLMTAEGLEMNDPEITITMVGDDGGTHDVEFQFEIVRVYCKQCRRCFTAVVGELAS